MTSPTTTVPTSGHQRKLAINRLRDRLATSDSGAVDRFLQRHSAPIIEGRYATFLWRGEAEEVMVRHRVVGLPDPLHLRRLADTDLWHATIELPEGSRVEYQFEVVRGGVREQYLNDPLNPRLAHWSVRVAVGGRRLGLRRAVVDSARPRGPSRHDRLDLVAQQGPSP